MPTTSPSLLSRGDTFFGVCEGLGEDLRIHPNLFRLSFAGLLFWNPVAAVVGYLAVGLVVALTRWLYPSPSAASEHKADAPAIRTLSPRQSSAPEPGEPDRLPLAA